MNQTLKFITAFILIILMCAGVACSKVSAEKKKSKYSVKIVSVTNEECKLKVKQGRYGYSEEFTLYKYRPKKRQWKEFYMCDIFIFSRRITFSKINNTYTIDFVKYYGRKLPEGRYKLKWNKNLYFRIK